MATRVYGACDDLIEIDGPNLSDEIAAFFGAKRLTFDNGVVLDITYDSPGFWRILVVEDPDGRVHVRRGADIDTDYSDVATISDDVSSVAVAEQEEGGS
jgi:hypothetical protein